MSLSRSHSSPLPSLPDYVIGEQLGKGTYATVYKAFKKGKKREIVAIKCVLKSSLSKTSVDNLLTEISITKKIKHKFIVELKDFQWDENYIYLIFEYCSDGELSKYIKSNKRLSEATVQHFLQQIATALKVLRENNIAHMDLKPQNILISSLSSQKSYRNVILKIADFGFAQYLRSNDAATSLRGSPLYMAPEILLKHKYDARVDLWSIGIILFECLFGYAPYSSETFAELAEKIKNPNPIVIPRVLNLSDRCRDLLTKLLQRDPEKRITFNDFFAHPFVDLEHMPSIESYNKGVEYIHDAVKKDNIGEYDESFKLYTKGLQYLVPIYNWGDGVNIYDDAKHELLKMKLMEYMQRAETIKKKCNLIILDHYDMEAIQRAYEKIDYADKCAIDGDLKNALKNYNSALEIAIPLIPKFKGKDKENFHGVVSNWMGKAEAIKAQLYQCDKNLSETIKSPKTEQSIPVNYENCDKIRGNNRIDALSYDKFISETFTSNKGKDSLLKPTCYVQ